MSAPDEWLAIGAVLEALRTMDRPTAIGVLDAVRDTLRAMDRSSALGVFEVVRASIERGVLDDLQEAAAVVAREQLPIALTAERDRIAREIVVLALGPAAAKLAERITEGEGTKREKLAAVLAYFSNPLTCAGRGGDVDDLAIAIGAALHSLRIGVEVLVRQHPQNPHGATCALRVQLDDRATATVDLSRLTFEVDGDGAP